MARTVSRARVARRIATGAAFGGGGIGLIGAAGVGVLLAEVQLAKRRVGIPDAPIPANGNGWYGLAYGEADALRLGVVGDSLAAGQGVRRVGQTPGALHGPGGGGGAPRAGSGAPPAGPRPGGGPPGRPHHTDTTA
ncbi:hypothetical protein LCE31_37765, partial [Streptomyces sp. 8L]|nr:hypothetical protein [Streptomyces sp. 8L]